MILLLTFIINAIIIFNININVVNNSNIIIDNNNDNIIIIIIINV